MIHKLKNKRGFSLIEIILAISIFSLSVMGLIGGLVYGQQSNKMAIDRGQAIFLADEGIEASTNIALDDFSNLVDGSFGLTVENNSYSFDGSSDFFDIYERKIIISSIDDNTKKIESRVSWPGYYNEDTSMTLTTYITNWK